jgi:hypothetical protein
MTRDWIRRLATALVSLFLIIIVEPFAHVNVEELNVLTRLLATLPDFSSFLDSSFFWFCFGLSIGIAAALWVMKIVPDKRLAFPPPLDPLLLEFNESTEGCRVPSTLTPDNENVILFRAIIKNPNNQDVGVRAYLVAIMKQDMAGNFVQCGYSENLLLTFAGEGPTGPGTFAIIHNMVPKFLGILVVGPQFGLKMSTENFFWPYASTHVFEQPGVYKIRVALLDVSHIGNAQTFEFILQWPGSAKWDETHLSLARKTA